MYKRLLPRLSKLAKHFFVSAFNLLDSYSLTYVSANEANYSRTC